MNLGALVIFGTIVAAVVLCVYGCMTFYGSKDVTIQVISSKVIPAEKGSYYIVYGKDSSGIRNVEIERPWWDWKDNRDNLLLQVGNQTGKTVTFECFGWENQPWEWYPLCYKEIQ